MKIWLVDKWINVPLPSQLPLRGVLLDVAYSATLKEQLSTCRPKQQPLWQIVRELASNPELIIKWGKFVINEGPRFTLNKIAARLDDIHIASLRACCSVAGRIEAIGSRMQGLKAGDRVAGVGFRMPTHAQFLVLREELCVVLPDEISSDQAAFILPGAMALYAVEQLLAMGGNGPVAVLGGTTWGIIAAQELRCRSEEVTLYLATGETSLPTGLPGRIIQQSGQDSLPEIISSSQRLILSHPKFMQHLIGNGQGRTCVVIHGRNNLCQQAAAAGWAVENIRLPDPEGEEQLNLDVYSDEPLDVPAWAKRVYLEGFIERLVQGKLQLGEPVARAEDYATQRGRSRLISYSPANKNRKRCLSNPASFPASGREKLKVSVVGAGNFSMHVHIPFLQYRPEVRLRGVVDLEPYQSYYVARFYGFEFFSTNPESVFTDQQTDWVFIVTYHDSHASLAIEALKAGKSVFLEKPPVVSYKQLADLAQAVKDYGGYLIVGYNRRFAPAIRAFSHLLTNMEGPSNITCNVRLWDVPANNWYFWNKEGTRICGNLCHFIDLCYFLTGRQRPVSVTAIPSTVGRPDQNIVATIRFQDGSLGNIIYSKRGNSQPAGEEWTDFRRGGLTVIIDDWQQMWARQDGRVVARWAGKKRDQGHENELVDTLQDLLQGQPSPYTLEDLVVTSLVMLKAKESMERKETMIITPEEIDRYL